MRDTTNTGGVGLGTIMLAIFVTLKLTGNIAWSWIWVLSPIWIGLAVGIFFMLVFSVMSAVTSRKL